MAIDLDAIRRKLNNLQSQTGRQDNLWKPEPGKQIIRIVPYQHNKENPFNEMYFHYDLGKRNYLSPVTYGEADPVEEFAQKLRATGKSDDFKLAKKLTPKMRVYVPVLVRGKESEGVKLWGFGKQVYTELLGFIADPDYGDITDVKAGRDVLVEFTPAEGVGQFPKTTIRVKPNQTAATEDTNIAEKIISGQKDIFDIFKKQSYDDLKAVLEEWLNPDGEEEKEVATSTSTGTKQTENIESAFDELFNE
tara:strand:+ start:648 stop:1394 length:747 start_codon:yes stop_codon:yes gene_type:complete